MDDLIDVGYLITLTALKVAVNLTGATVHFHSCKALEHGCAEASVTELNRGPLFFHDAQLQQERGPNLAMDPLLISCGKHGSGQESPELSPGKVVLRTSVGHNPVSTDVVFL